VTYLYLRHRTPTQAAAELLPAHVGHMMHAALRGTRFELFAVNAIDGATAQVTTRNGTYEVPSAQMWLYGTPQCLNCVEPGTPHVGGEDRAI